MRETYREMTLVETVGSARDRPWRLAARSIPADLRLAIALCLFLRTIVLVLQGLALYVTITFNAGVELWSRTKVDTVPKWISVTNLIVIGHREAVAYALGLVFLGAFALTLHLTAKSLTAVGVPPPWIARWMPVAMLVPYVNLVVPWIGLHQTRLALRRMEDPQVSFDLPTIVFALVFDFKLVGDRLFSVPDLQPDVFQGIPRVPYFWTNADSTFHFGIEAALSLVLLVALCLYCRAFANLYGRSRDKQKVAAF